MPVTAQSCSRTCAVSIRQEVGVKNEPGEVTGRLEFGLLELTRGVVIIIWGENGKYSSMFEWLEAEKTSKKHRGTSIKKRSMPDYILTE